MAFPVEARFIDAAEERLGRTLPPDHRARLLVDNGGDLFDQDDGWQLYPVLDQSDRKRLSRTADDIVRNTAEARKWVGFPPDAIAIATNGTGDLLVLLAGSDQIHQWFHETGETAPRTVRWHAG